MNKKKPEGSDYSRYLPVAAFCGFFVVFFLGVHGFVLLGDDGYSAVYKAIQLVVLEGNFDGIPIGWRLQTARFLLPAFTVTTIIWLLLRFAGQQINFLRNRIFGRETILIGAGRVAGAIVKNLPPGKKILVVDLNIDQALAQFIRTTKPGSIFLQCDATNTRILKRLNLPQAKDIYIFTGDDSRDLDIAMSVLGILLGAEERKTKLPRLIVDLDDKVLLRCAAWYPVFRNYKNRGGEVVWFSANAQVARMLLLRHPPIDLPSQSVKEPVHLALVGFGPIGQEIVLQAVRHLVFFREAPITISIFGEDEGEFLDFLDRHPVLRPDANDPVYGGLPPFARLRFHRCQPTAPIPNLVRQAMEEVGARLPFAKVYVTAADDHLCLYTSYRFKQSLLSIGESAAIVCCFPGTHFHETDYADSFQCNNKEFCGDIEFFHGLSSLLHQGEDYPGCLADEVGMMINAAYQAVFLDPELRGDEADFAEKFEIRFDTGTAAALTAWKALDDELRWSSRHAGDHVFIKLRELGFALVDTEWACIPECETITPEDPGLMDLINQRFDELVCMEHRRFCVERLLGGWLYSESDLKKMQLNKTLSDFNRLKKDYPDQLAKDGVIIRVLPHILRKLISRGHYQLAKLP